MPIELGVRACDGDCEYARSRVKPKCCSQLRFGDRTTVLALVWPLETLSKKPEPTLTCCQEPMKPRRPSGAYSTM